MEHATVTLTNADFETCKTAFHEAGHTVAAIVDRLHHRAFAQVFEYVTVVSIDESLGHVSLADWTTGLSPNARIIGHPSNLKALCVYLTMLVSGVTAEFLFVNRYRSLSSTPVSETDMCHVALGAWDDYDNVVSAFDQWKHPVGESRRKMLDLVEKRAIQLLCPNWPAIDALARELILRKRLTYRQALLVVRRHLPNRKGYCPPLPSASIVRRPLP